MKQLILILSLVSSSYTLTAQSIDQLNSKVKFEVSNMGVRVVSGTFSGMEGTIQFDEQDMTDARFNVCIDAKSVDTDNEKRDKHLLEEDFFHVEEYPTICFESSAISKATDGYMADGTLTMKGVSEEVSIPFTYSNNTFTGSLSVERKAYGVGPKSGLTVGKTIDMEIVCVVQ